MMPYSRVRNMMKGFYPQGPVRICGGRYSHVDEAGNMDWLGGVKFREEVQGCRNRQRKQNPRARYGRGRHRFLALGQKEDKTMLMRYAAKYCIGA